MTGQVIGISIYAFAAFGLAVLLVVGLGVALHAGKLIRNDPLPLLFFGILFSIMASPIATGRILTAGLFARDASLEEIGSSFWISRIVTLLVLALSAERVLRFVVRRDRAVSYGWPLFWAFFAYAFSNQILNSIFGANPSFDHKALYAFLIYFAVFLSAQQQPEHCLRIARTALLVFLVASAAVALAKPTMVIEQGYTGGLPGLNFRYYGLATHANTMGPLAIAFMICLSRFPFKIRAITVGAWLLAVGSLITSQSKTSIAIAVALGLLLAVYQYRARLIERSPGRRFRVSLATVALGAFLLAAAIVAFYFGSGLLEPQLRKWDSASGGQISSLTGRTRIWGIAWYEFMTHPVFGYGPSIWGPVYRFDIGAQFANHAHNQLLQSLSSAGAVGAAGLVAYVVALLVFGFRAAERSGGISLALVGLLLFRTFSEVPLSVAQAMQSEFLIQLLALIACVGFAPATQTTRREEMMPVPLGSRVAT